MVAEVGPVGVVADLNGLDAVGPGAGKKDVIDVVAAILAVPEIVSGASLLALRLGKEMVIGADEAALLEQTHDSGVVSCFAMVIPEFVAVEIAAEDDGLGIRWDGTGRREAGLKPGLYRNLGRGCAPKRFASEPLRVIGDGFVDLADVAFDDAALDGHGPHGNQTKVACAAGDGQRNDPAVGRLLGAGDSQRLGDEDAESLARIIAEPASFEMVVEPRIEIAFGAFGNDGDVGTEVIKRLAFARKRHSAIPDDDFHEERMIGYHGR